MESWKNIGKGQNSLEHQNRRTDKIIVFIDAVNLTFKDALAAGSPPNQENSATAKNGRHKDFLRRHSTANFGRHNVKVTTAIL